MSDEPRSDRDSFAHFLAIPTRWMDNDVYGHVNNVVYYSYFDTVVNKHLVDEAELDPETTPVVGLVVETRCQFKKELAFPEVIDAGMRVKRLGRSSIVYEIGLFKQGDEEAAAFGHFVHVYVDRESRQTVPVPERVRRAVASLVEAAAFESQG